jgi:putative salt-induced outer membrane protein YdiY
MRLRRASVTALFLTLLPCAALGASTSFSAIPTPAARNPEFDLTKDEFRADTRFGFVMKQGNKQKETLSGSSYTLYRVHRWENKWKLYVLIDRVFNDSSDNFDTFIYGTYRMDYYITNRLSYYIGGGGYSDEVKGIDRSALGFNGISYFLIRNPKLYLRGSLGYLYSFEHPVSPFPDDSIHSAAEELEFSYTINNHFSIYEDVSIYENVQVASDLRILSDTELKAGLTNHFAVVIAYRIRFDNQPIPTFEKLDTITDVSLSLSF